jgi:hypothetical protein
MSNTPANTRTLSPSEALFGFCGWLTTRDKITRMGLVCECSEIPDLIVEFCEFNNLPMPEHDWHKNLNHPKE